MALTDNIVSYWKMDESSGNAADSVSTNTLTNTGTITYGTGKINNGATLNGTSQYFVSTSSAIQATGDQSWSFWIKPEAASGSRYLLWNTYQTGNDGIILSLENSTGLKLRIHTFTAGGTVSKNSTNLATITGDGSTWTLLTIVYTASAGTFDVYVNGSFVTQATGHQTAMVVTGQVTWGQDSGHGAGNYFKGMVDEMVYWTRPLNGTDASDLYNGGTGIQYPFTATINSNFLIFM